MSHIIIQKNGKFNIYSTIVDDCLFDSPLIESEVRIRMIDEHGKKQEQTIERMIDKAKTQGTSSMLFKTLESVAECNCLAGNGKPIPSSEFLERYL